MATKKSPLPERVQYMDSALFRHSVAMERYGETKLPPLPPAMLFDVNELQNRSSGSYVMSREEEVQRFLEFNYAKLQVNRTIDILESSALLASRPAARRKAFAELRSWHARARHLQEYITRINMPLIYSQVARNRYRHQHLDWSEAVSEGHPVIIRVVNKFNAQKGNKFSTYACRAIINSLQRGNAIARKKSSRVSYVELPDNFADIPEEGPEDNAELLEALRKSVTECGLTDTEQVVITRRFGLAGTKRLTLEAVGDIIGVTKERVRQIQLVAERKIREHLEASLV